MICFKISFIILNITLINFQQLFIHKVDVSWTFTFRNLLKQLLTDFNLINYIYLMISNLFPKMSSNFYSSIIQGTYLP